MKTLKTLSALVLAAGLIFTSSCKKSTTTDPSTPVSNNPTISLVGGTGYATADYTATVGDAPMTIKTISLSNTTSGSKLDHVYISKTSNNMVIYSVTNTFTASITSHSDSLSIPTSTAGSVRVEFTVTDKAGLTATVGVNVTIVAAPPALMAIGSGNITLGGASSSLPSYMNLYTGLTYLSNAASSNPGNVELVYNNGNVYSPKDALETNPNISSGGVATTLNVYTAKTYTAITAADVAAYTPTGATKVTTLVAGTVVMFSTLSTGSTPTVKKGVFVVNSITASTNASDNIVIHGQIQQ